MNNADLQELYRRTLLDDVIPFWLKHGIDHKHGGLANVMDDAGTHLNYDKYIWSQGRALWTFSALCRRIEDKPEYRAAADHIFAYLTGHGPGDKGNWMFRFGPDGTVLDKDISIYVDGFVMTGMAEYFALAGKQQALAVARETAGTVRERLAVPGTYGVAPYTIPAGLKTHGINMIFSYFLYGVGRIARDTELKQIGLEMADEIINDFYVPSKDAVLEFVTIDGRFIDTPEGRSCVPGHVLEAMWFLISMFEKEGRNDDIRRCCSIISRHLELGWDTKYGGIRLALDIDGREPVFWGKPDCKPWWVQLEALVATAYAYLHTGEDVFMEWHERIREYAFSCFPVATGEWRQWLTRDGKPAESAALPVKDPFHLPRALMELVDVFGRIRQKQVDSNGKKAV